MAADAVESMTGGGHIILAGLLVDQEAAVKQAYSNQGLRFIARLQNGDWPTLLFQKPLEA